MIRELLAVAAGGVIGTAARLAIDSAFPHEPATLAINVVGAFLLGMLVARVWPRASSWVRAGLGAGLLGSFTTFSAVAVSLVSLSARGDWLTALGYLALTLVLGLGAAALGLAAGRRR